MPPLVVAEVVDEVWARTDEANVNQRIAEEEIPVILTIADLFIGS